MDLNRRLADIEIWQHARDNDLVIVSKDTDFSDRISLSNMIAASVPSNRSCDLQSKIDSA